MLLLLTESALLLTPSSLVASGSSDIPLRGVVALKLSEY